MSPLFVFDRNRLIVVYNSAFEADMHEDMFDPKYWARAQYLICLEEDIDKSIRGNAYVSFLEPFEALANISRQFNLS